MNNRIHSYNHIVDSITSQIHYYQEADCQEGCSTNLMIVQYVVVRDTVGDTCTASPYTTLQHLVHLKLKFSLLHFCCSSNLSLFSSSSKNILSLFLNPSGIVFTSWSSHLLVFLLYFIFFLSFNPPLSLAQELHQSLLWLSCSSPFEEEVNHSH